MIRSTSMSISSLDQLWSPRQFSANGKGQTPLEVGSWDYYFCSDQSQETNWKLKITSDTNTSSIVKLQVYHLPSSPIKIESVSCTLFYSAYSLTNRADTPSSPRHRQVTEFDVHVRPDHRLREWVLVLEIPGCHLSNVDRDVSFSAIYRKLAKDDADGCLATSSLSSLRQPEEAGPTPVETLADDLLMLLNSEQNADVEFVVVEGGGGGAEGGRARAGARIDEEQVENVNQLSVHESQQQQWPQSDPASGNLSDVHRGGFVDNVIGRNQQLDSRCDDDNNNHSGYINSSSNDNNNSNDFSTNNSNVVMIKAHKAILTARVPYFERLFASGMQETESNRVVVKDATAEDFRQFLRFVYAGEKPENIEEKPWEFLALSEKYEIGFLKNICEINLTKKLLKSNLVETLVWADLYRCETLKTECLRKFQEWRQRISTEELKPLKKYPELMFEMLSFGGK